MQPADHGSKWKNINARCENQNHVSTTNAAAAWIETGDKGWLQNKKKTLFFSLKRKSHFARSKPRIYLPTFFSTYLKNMETFVRCAKSFMLHQTRKKNVGCIDKLHKYTVQSVDWIKSFAMKYWHFYHLLRLQKSNSRVSGQLGSSVSIVVLLYEHIGTKSQFICWYRSFIERFLSWAGCCAIRCCRWLSSSAEIPETRASSHSSTGNWLNLFNLIWLPQN